MRRGARATRLSPLVRGTAGWGRRRSGGLCQASRPSARLRAAGTPITTMIMRRRSCCSDEEPNGLTEVRPSSSLLPWARICALMVSFRSAANRRAGRCSARLRRRSHVAALSSRRTRTTSTGCRETDKNRPLGWDMLDNEVAGLSRDHGHNRRRPRPRRAPARPAFRGRCVERSRMYREAAHKTNKRSFLPSRCRVARPSATIRRLRWRRSSAGQSSGIIIRVS